MKLLVAITLVCLSESISGAPQFGRILEQFGYNPVGNPHQVVRNIQPQPLSAYYKPSSGLTLDSSFGSFPLSSQNELSIKERGQLLPVMKVLLKVMETSKPDPKDVNNLLVLTRDLIKEIPEGDSAIPSLKKFGFDIESIGGFGLDGIKNIGLPETGNLIVMRCRGIECNVKPYIVTQFGSFPLADVSLMTNEERQQFLQAVRSFVEILQKDTIDPNEIKTLAKQVKKLDSWNLFPFDIKETAEKNGFNAVANPSQVIRNIPCTSQRSSGLDIDTQFGSFPLSSVNQLTPAERGQLLPIMQALEKVMESEKPAPEAVNSLLVYTRDLLKEIPEGDTKIPSLKSFGFDVDSIDGFGLDGLKNIGLPETGEIIVMKKNEPYIVTQWGSFPLSDVNLMTEKERKQFLPAVRSFIEILQKDNITPDEIKSLGEEARKLDSLNLFPFNIRQAARQNGYNTAKNPLETVRKILARPLTAYTALPSCGGVERTSGSLGLTLDSSFGSFPLSSENGLKVVRPQLLPVMKALLKVMETNKPEPKDVNKLLVLTRELMDLIPDGGDFALPSLKQYGFDVDSIEGFGLDGIKKIGLPDTGDITVMKSNRPYVVTQWGSFPVSDVSLMVDEEREQFLPVIRTFTSILEKDTLDPKEVKLLGKQANKLDSWNLFPFTFRETAEEYGFPILSNPSEQILPVQAKPLSSYKIETAFGTFPLTDQSSLTPSERKQLLPVMTALLKVMETKNPASEDINTLLTLTRDLINQIPDSGLKSALPSLGFGQQFQAFGLQGIENMGLPETGDIIVKKNNIPHIVTQWGSFPLSEVSLMTDEERQKFLPAVRKLTELLKKEKLEPEDIKSLGEETKELDTLNLFPFNLKTDNGK